MDRDGECRIVSIGRDVECSMLANEPTRSYIGPTRGRAQVYLRSTHVHRSSNHNTKSQENLVVVIHPYDRTRPTYQQRVYIHDLKLASKTARSRSSRQPGSKGTSRGEQYIALYSSVLMPSGSKTHITRACLILGTPKHFNRSPT